MKKENLNILLTEDSQDDIELTQIALKKLGHFYRLDQATTGEECLKKISMKKYHLLLLDYQIPGGDGLFILKEIRKKGLDLPIIMVTGQGSEKVAVETIKQGAQDYIVKTGDYFKTLPLVIKNVVEKHKLHKEKEALEKEIRFEKEKLRLIFDNMGDGVCVIDSKFKILLYNKQFEKFFGKISSDYSCFKAIKDAGGSFPDCLIKKHEIDIGQSTHFEVISKDRKTLMVTFTPFHNLEGDKVYLEVFKDITERKESEKKLYIASITDSLTELFNQGHFLSELEKEVNRSRRNKRPLSLILFDLDRFKEFNDKYGHQEGDKALKIIGEVVKKEIRKELDLAFRYGGDEFTIILPEASFQEAQKIAQRIKNSFETYKLTTLSIGIVELSKDMDIESFIKGADLAMYEAKKSLELFKIN